MTPGRYERLLAWVERDAARAGISREDLGNWSLDGFHRWTRSQRILRLVRIAYYRGWGRGIRDVREGETPIGIPERPPGETPKDAATRLLETMTDHPVAGIVARPLVIEALRFHANAVRAATGYDPGTEIDRLADNLERFLGFPRTALDPTTWALVVVSENAVE